jgi:hypothetical protein
MTRPADDYLTKKRGKDGKLKRNWYVKFTLSDHQIDVARTLLRKNLPRYRSISMGTPDRDLARARSHSLVGEHIALLLLARGEIDPVNKWGDYVMKPRWAPGRYQNEHGWMEATEDEVLLARPYEAPKTMSNPWNLTVDWTDYARRQPEYLALVEHRRKHRPSSHDATVIETYIEKTKQADEDAALLRKVLGDWQVAARGKNFSTAKRADAEALVRHLKAGRGEVDKCGQPKRLSAGRVERIVSALKAAVDYDIDHNEDSRIRRNIFRKQKVERDPGETMRSRAAFEEHHIETIKANRHMFSDMEWLMVVFHISTGIRMEGLVSIEYDFWEERKDAGGTIRKTRGFYVLKDKDKSGAILRYGPRALPFPQAVLDALKLDGTPLLPDKITAGLFPSDLNLKSFLAKINYRLEQIGVKGKGNGITFYSGRHRADRRMADAKVDEPRQLAIRGHVRELDAIRKTKNPREMYGRGDYGHKFDLFALKPDIDTIGF